jgi:hypothetical protein
MKIISGIKLCIGAALIGAASGAVPIPVSNVQVTLKGKKYQIDDVTTVSELQERLEEQSGIVPSKQGKILHNGKRLSAGTDAESLSEAGVSEGDQLNCVPSKKSSSSSSSKKKSTASKAAAASDASASSAASDPMADMMKGISGMGGMDDMVKNMMAGGMGGGSGPGGMPDAAESIKMMKDLTDSPMFADFMENPERLEEARQVILSNPMMKGMMASMPGMSDILEDKDAWAQAMQAAAGIVKQMDPDDMMKVMEAQAGGMGGMPPGLGGGAGLFDGAGASSSALDELSEGED